MLTRFLLLLFASFCLAKFDLAKFTESRSCQEVASSSVFNGGTLACNNGHPKTCTTIAECKGLESQCPKKDAKLACSPMSTIKLCTCGPIPPKIETQKSCKTKEDCPKCQFDKACFEGKCYCTTGAGSKKCNANLGEACPNNQVCDPVLGKCVDRPKCAFFGKSCAKEGCCAPGHGGCHLRKGAREKTCVRTALTGEDCSKLGCEARTVCLSNKKCSAYYGGTCYSQAECPTGSTCTESGAHGKQCLCDNGFQNRCE